MGPLPMIYGSTIDAVARADYERSQLQQRRSEWAAQNLRSASALHSQNRQQQFQNKFAQEARALQQAENDRQAEFAERQWRSGVFEREQDRISRERIAGSQISEQAEYRRQLKEMDIEARKEAAKAAREARDQELQWRKDEDARRAQHDSERRQVDSISRNIDRGREYTGDQLDEMAQGVSDPLLRMQLEGLAEDARSLEFRRFEHAQLRAEELNARIAESRSRLEEARERPTGLLHWERTKKNQVASRDSALRQDIETAKGTLARDEEGLVRWDERLQQFVPAVPPPSRRQPTSVGRQMLPTNDPAADPWRQIAQDEQWLPGAAAPPPPPQVLPLGASAAPSVPPQTNQYPAGSITIQDLERLQREGAANAMLPPDQRAPINPDEMLDRRPSNITGPPEDIGPFYMRLPSYGSSAPPAPQAMIEPGYQEEVPVSQYMLTDAPPAYSSNASAFPEEVQQPYTTMDAPAMIPPPFEPPERETPEQILARGGRPIDFSVTFPSGTGPGGMYVEGELQQFTTEDMRNYQNKLAQMLGERTPDGSPLHSDEEARRIAVHFMIQQKSAPILGR